MTESSLPVRVAVVCEAAADLRTARTLACRVLSESSGLDRFRDPDSNVCRFWVGVEAGTEFLAWRDVQKEAARFRFGSRTHGHFDGQPGAPDALAARRALLVFNALTPKPSAVILLRDSDCGGPYQDCARLKGLNQARDAFTGDFKVLIGVAHPKRECWILSAFQPRTPAEEAKMADLRKELDFDPRTESHRLDASGDQHKRSAKRVVRQFFHNEPDREEQELRGVSLDEMETRGAGNGLAPFIAEVRTHLPPLMIS